VIQVFQDCQVFQNATRKEIVVVSEKIREELLKAATDVTLHYVETEVDKRTDDPDYIASRICQNVTSNNTGARRPPANMDQSSLLQECPLLRKWMDWR